MKELIEKYIAASVNYGMAAEEGNSKEANKQSGIIRKIRKQLKESSCVDLLFSSLKHDNDYVKLNAAAALISAFPEEAKATLQELQTRKGLAAFEAEMFLREWEKGNIKY